ncbi:MAG: hypothetical protein IPK60_04915 [Sandaracinaceae bacterium]|nr:hypothetical protein [Sandaracinaceae bacterium]
MSELRDIHVAPVRARYTDPVLIEHFVLMREVDDVISGPLSERVVSAIGVANDGIRTLLHFERTRRLYLKMLANDPTAEQLLAVGGPRCDSRDEVIHELRALLEEVERDLHPSSKRDARGEWLRSTALGAAARAYENAAALLSRTGHGNSEPVADFELILADLRATPVIERGDGTLPMQLLERGLKMNHKTILRYARKAPVSR